MSHIALYIGSLSMGGAERVMAGLAVALYERGHEVTLVTTYLADEEYELSHALWERVGSPKEKGAVRVLNTDEKPVFVRLREGEGIRRVFSGVQQASSKGPAGRAAAFWKRLSKLRGIFADLRPDVILSFLGKNNLMALMAAGRIPVAVSVRAFPELEYPGIEGAVAKLLFHRARAVVFQTRAAAMFFPKAVRRRGVILPNAVSPEFLAGALPAERERTIVAVGRMDANKRFDLLLRAFAEICKDPEFDEYRLLLYGDGEDRRLIEDMAKDLGVWERTAFCGQQSGIADKIRAAGVYCLMSDTEGMPNTLIEALCLGIPSVATDCVKGGLGRIFVDGEDLLIVPTRDHEALSGAIRRLLTDKGLCERLSSRVGRHRRRFSPDNVTKRWERMLSEAMGL